MRRVQALQQTGLKRYPIIENLQLRNDAEGVQCGTISLSVEQFDAP
jgi:hypothetical protein